jgi:hypothetical protein
MHGYALVPQREVDSRAVFEEIHWPDGRVSLRGQDLAYVVVHDSGAVQVNATSPDSGARLICEPVPAVPGQRRSADAPPAGMPMPRAHRDGLPTSARTPR